ncbi:MAG: SGNH/GDSL hydrolase family protein [Microbacteriaceae bacterium]
MPALRLSRLAMIPLAPVLFAQGRRLRRDTPRLPDAAAPWSGSQPGPDPIRLLVLGDSTAAGVGADTQALALPGNLARELAARWSRGVEWTAMGENGATARDVVERFLPDAVQHEYDFVFLSIGANDALGLRSRRAFGRDIRTLLSSLHNANPHAQLMMSSLPAFFRFELLPNPLRYNLYLHSQNLEAEARRVVQSFAGAIMSPPPPPYTAGFFAADLFHPSASGYSDWARFAVDDAFAKGQLR